VLRGGEEEEVLCWSRGNYVENYFEFAFFSLAGKLQMNVNSIDH
jgi:hypothetical protein